MKEKDLSAEAATQVFGASTAEYIDYLNDMILHYMDATAEISKIPDEPLSKARADRAILEGSD